MNILRDVTLQSLIDSMPCIFSITDCNSKFLAVSEWATKLIGYDKPEHLHGLSWQDMRADAVVMSDKFYDEDRLVNSEKQPIKLLGYLCYQGDDWHTLVASKSPLRNQQGDIVGIITQGYDLTDSYLIDLGRFLIKQNKCIDLIQSVLLSFVLPTLISQQLPRYCRSYL